MENSTPAFSIKKFSLKVLKWYGIGLFISYLLFYFIGFYENANGDFKKVTLPDFKQKNQFGELTSFHDYKGKTVLIDFWFVGCGPCLEEMKYYAELLEKYKDELVILSYSIDQPEAVTHIVQNHPEPWSFLPADNKNWLFFSDTEKGNSYSEALQIREFPTYFLINKNGELIDTPKSGLFGVERELSGYLGLRLAFIKFNNSAFIKNHTKTILILFTLLFGAGLLLYGLIRLVISSIRRRSQTA